jgi:hypothetical protein
MGDDIPLMLERKNGEPEYVNQLKVGFGLMPIEDKAESRKAGRPIFKDVEHIEILVPGDVKSRILRPASAKDRADFPRAYAAFKSQQVVAQQGTPIELWPQVTRGEALSLKAAGISTVEDLAEVHDGNLQKLGYGIREMRAKARAYVNQAKDTAAVQEMAVRNQDLEQRLADQQRQITELAAMAAAWKAQADAAAPTADEGIPMALRRTPKGRRVGSRLQGHEAPQACQAVAA